MILDRKLYKKDFELSKKKCPFCDMKSQWDLVIWKGDYWYIQHNKYPYLWLEEHLMVIPLSHKVFANELSEEEFWEMAKVQKFIKNYYWDKQYFSFMRETLWKRSIEHLHYQYLPWVLRTSRIENILKEQWF